ncbi:hypothetical protein Tco_0597938 [Tanacetum coccineum]
MVACLEKSEENVEFHQIVDFLSTCSINYALTVSPTIYASYIEQFWNTATSKTVNLVKQIHAIVDGKAMVISESSVRSDLLFNDEDGIACLTNDEIFENLALMGYEHLSTKLTFQKGKFTPLFDSMLVQNQAPKGEGSTTPLEPQPTSSTSQPNVFEPLTEPLQTETPPPVFHEPQTKAHIEKILPSLTTYQRKRKTQKRNGYRWQSLSLRHHGGASAQTRSERVLEKPNEPPLSEGHTSGSREGSMEYHFELTDNVPPTPHDSPLSGEEAKTAQDRRGLFKGRVETSTNTSLGEDASKQGMRSDKTKPMFKDSDFDVLDAEQITTTGPSHVSTAMPKMKEEKAKEKGVEFRNVEEATRPVRSITTLQPLPMIDPKDKELAELDRAQIERQRQEEATNAALTEEFDEIQARIDADALFAAKLQLEEREREQFTIEERAQFLVEKIAAYKKFKATQRAAEIRSKPPIKTQLRNLMMTYLKNTGGYKHSQLKGKTYEEIHELYERQQKRNQGFIPMDSEKEAQKSEEEAEEYEKEKEELSLSLKIISSDNSEVNYEPLSRRFPIVNWEYKLLGNVDAKDMYAYKLTRSDGSSSYHGDMQAFLRRLDRQDLNDLYRSSHTIMDWYTYGELKSSREKKPTDQGTIGEGGARLAVRTSERKYYGI